MFKLNPTLAQFYPFYKDEWNRISYVDYNGTYPEQSSNTWFILFRDIFYAQPSNNESSNINNNPVLILPKIYCNISNHMLKVINNDTYKELPKVFNKVSPYTYTKNKVLFLI